MVRGASTSDSVELQSLTGRKIGKSDEPAQLGEHDRDIASFEGFITPLWKQFVFYILGLISGGVVFLCAKWSLKMKVALTLTACPLPEAEWVLVTLVDKRQELTRVSRMTSFASINIQASSAAVYVHADGGITNGMNSAAGVTGDGFDRMLEYRCGRYIYSYSQGTFLPVPATPSGFVDELNTAAVSRRVKGPLTSGNVQIAMLSTEQMN